MNIAFTLLSGAIGGLLAWLAARIVCGRADMRRINPLEESTTFWALIIGMAMASIGLLLLPSVLVLLAVR